MNNNYENTDVRFYSLYGDAIYGYSKKEFLALTEMPPNPKLKNFISQGWNYTLNDAQNYVRKYGVLDIGQMYIPTDEKTHIIIEVKNIFTIPITIQQTITNGVIINWGDNSTEETIEGVGVVTTSHVYNSKGLYEITLNPKKKCKLGFGGNDNLFSTPFLSNNSTFNGIFYKAIKKIYIGKNVESIGPYAFHGSVMSLEELTIPFGVKEILKSSLHVLSLKTNLIIPNTINIIDESSLADNNTKHICIPKVNIINAYAFNCSYDLKSIMIPENVTIIKNTSFYDIPEVEKIIVPEGVTQIENNSFYFPNKLKYLYLPSTLTTIGDSAFAGPWTLRELIIPENVSSIGTNAFNACYILNNLILKPTIPPTLSNANTFGLMPSDCTITVPYSSDHSILEAYKTANIWSTWASQMTDMSPKQLQAIAESGKADEFFNIGDEIIIPWTDNAETEPVTYQYPFVVAHIGDCYDENDVKHENAIWLMAKYATPKAITFDASEGIEVDLSQEPNALEGWYYYGQGNDGIHNKLDLNVGDAIPTTYTTIRKCGIDSVPVLNFGYSRWRDSAYRQWLNSDVEKNEGWWSAQHFGDQPPEISQTNLPGWLNGFTEEWKSIFKPVLINTACNTPIDQGVIDTTYDKFFLPSIEQVYGIPQVKNVEGEYWEYWKNETGLTEPSYGTSSNPNDARKIPSIANPTGSAVNCRLRSAYLTTGHGVWYMQLQGRFIGTSMAYLAFNAQPSCVIY